MESVNSLGNIDPKDLKVESTYVKTGWSVPDAGVRVTHIPSGIIVESRSERSQHKNRDNALKELQEKLKNCEPKPPDQHPDDLAVDKFAAMMKAKLVKSREKGRGGWDNPDECSVEYLAKLLIEHVAKGDPVDVANFAMMLALREDSDGALKDSFKRFVQSVEIDAINDRPLVR